MRLMLMMTLMLGFVTTLGCQTQQEGDPEFTQPIVTGGPLVEMDGFRFVPSAITVTAGDTVEWRNTTRTEHTVTCDPALANNPQNVVLPENTATFHSGTIRPGESYFHTFSRPGRYRYICVPHETYGMIGEVTVLEPMAVPDRQINGALPQQPQQPQRTSPPPRDPVIAPQPGPRERPLPEQPELLKPTEPDRPLPAPEA